MGTNSSSTKVTKFENKTSTAVHSAAVIALPEINILDSESKMRINILGKHDVVHVMPLMPDDEDEQKALTADDMYCQYCGNVCDINFLKCKVCTKVSHIGCLYNRGHLNTPLVTTDIEWSCADCSDLTRLLADEQMLSLIELFDDLVDTNKDCLVRCEQYIKSKKRLCEQFNMELTQEDERIERRNFRLMDTDNSGSLTWNEFVNYETLSLLSRKNKVELANCLTLKELVLIKRIFFSHDLYKFNVISKEAAQSVYNQYYIKLKNKLGRSFQEHIKNCDTLLGLQHQNTTLTSSLSDSAIINHKVTWDEFVRKLSIFIIFDRLNSSHYSPQLWAPGSWYTKNTKRTLSRDLTMLKLNQRKTTRLFQSTSLLLAAQNHTTSIKNNNSIEVKLNSSTMVNTQYLMKNDMKLENYEPYDQNDFGCSLYVINDNDDANDATDTALITEIQKHENNMVKKTTKSNKLLVPSHHRVQLVVLYPEDKNDDFGVGFE